ncbi:hypothetical protein AB0D08_18655 [Kitasatospora sp. NPDC048540]|uniref:hypothetical protein n=1 Tax=unclassified Kitasatospora TaxID=2633591 RepID=UPI0011EA6CDA|nr:hypothetical protein [Kitasatospora sp. MBT63]
MLQATGPGDEVLRRIALPRAPGALLTAFLPVADGFLLVWEPGTGRHFAQVEQVGDFDARKLPQLPDRDSRSTDSPQDRNGNVFEIRLVVVNLQPCSVGP